MYGGTASACQWCGHYCGCSTRTSATVYTFRPDPNAKSWEEVKRERELEKLALQREARQLSIDMGRDYSLRPEPPPPAYDGRQSTSFHWMSQRKRSFKMRPNRPGWDRGR